MVECRNRMYELERLFTELSMKQLYRGSMTNVAMEQPPKNMAYRIGLLQRVIKKYEKVDGFSASSYFNLNRNLLTSIVGSLVTYLIVLLQFKIADLQSHDNASSSSALLNGTDFQNVTDIEF